MDYTHEQQEIFEHDPSKHACILAGPGTGKSSTIIAYIAKIDEQQPTKRLRLLTFTRAANSELADKILEAGHEKVASSTIHSFAISLLLSNPGSATLPAPLRIADDWQWDELIKKDFAKRLSIKSKVVEKLKKEMAATWESLVPGEDPGIPSAIRARFMGLWEEHRRLYGYTLLSELPFRLKEALEGNPDLNLSDIELIAVDEYQDLNACDLKCFKLLAERGVTIFAVGDDDQSIYQFRKAHPIGIRNFPQDYQAPGYPLTISHRCGTKILDWANYVIGGDTTRPQKQPLCPSGHNPDGSVGYFVFNREDKEAEGIVRLANWLHSGPPGIPLEEILVLVRTTTIAKWIKGAFQKANVPYSDPEDALNALKHSNSRELFSVFRLILNRTDSLAWWTLLRLTQRIGYAAIDQFYQLARTANCQFGEALFQEAENGFQNISTGRSKISARAQHVLQLIDALDVPDETEWGSWIIEQVNNGKLPGPAEGVRELLTKIDDHKDLDEQVSLDRYVNQVEPLVKDIMNSKIPDCARIMTLGRSKGLTVRATIIAGVEDGVIPHPKFDPQEERRLLYVGMTRAREHLYLTRCRRRTGPTARSGQTNVASLRRPCPFLDGGPVSQMDGQKMLGQVGV